MEAYEQSINIFGVIMGRPERKRPLKKPRHRREDDIKLYLKEMGYDARSKMALAQDRGQWGGVNNGDNKLADCLKANKPL